jgi:sortase (surface protein transpeptidase)
MVTVQARPGRPDRLGGRLGGRVPLGLASAVLLVAGLFATGVGLAEFGGGPPLPGLSAAVAGPPRPAAAALTRSTPTRISIPSIGVGASIEPVGLAADGTIATPSLGRKNVAGWFAKGPTPGEYGPAVIVGHVDTTKGPSVFYKLGHVLPGQEIKVTRRDHHLAVFRVDSVQVFDKSQVPAKEVYGDFSRPGLRLITCGGQWVGGDTGYADNIIVFATLIKT